MGLYSNDDYFSAWSAQPAHNWLSFVRAGIVSGHAEVDLRIMVLNTRARYDGLVRYTYDTLEMTVEAGLGIYSLVRDRVRLRHGFHLGLWIAAYVDCRTGDRLACLSDRGLDRPEVARYPSADAHLIDVLIRLFDGLWLEVSPANVGVLAIYSASIGLRWERVRIR